MTSNTKPKRPVGRPPRVRFPEIPSFYKDTRNLRGTELQVYEALRSALLAQEPPISEG